VNACPTISFFTGTPVNIFPGASSALQWNATTTGQVLLDGSPVPANGSRVVNPTTTTTYRLTAVSSNGTCNAERFVTITVTPCPAPQITSFTANPSSVLAGGNQMVRLAWTINDTSSTGITVNINPGVGSFSTSNGFVDITQPQSTTTYTITVTNGCGTTSTAQATVTANSCPAPTINNFSANPNSVTVGGNQIVRLSWNITDNSGTGITVSIAGLGTWATAAGFVDIAQPQSTTTYNLTATSGCGASASTQTTVTASPPAATTAHITLPFFAYSQGGVFAQNPNHPTARHFPGDYTFTASAGTRPSVSIQFGSYQIPFIDTCYGTQSFVAAEGPWVLSLIAADNTVLDSFTFERGSYSGSSLTWTGNSPLPQAATKVTFTAPWYTNRYQLARDSNECELVIDHYIQGIYIGTLDLSTGTFTNSGTNDGSP
jgi:hypothetical protein